MKQFTTYEKIGLDKHTNNHNDNTVSTNFEYILNYDTLEDDYVCNWLPAYIILYWIDRYEDIKVDSFQLSINNELLLDIPYFLFIRHAEMDNNIIYTLPFEFFHFTGLYLSNEKDTISIELKNAINIDRIELVQEKTILYKETISKYTDELFQLLHKDIFFDNQQKSNTIKTNMKLKCNINGIYVYSKEKIKNISVLLDEECKLIDFDETLLECRMEEMSSHFYCIPFNRELSMDTYTWFTLNNNRITIKLETFYPISSISFYFFTDMMIEYKFNQHILKKKDNWIELVGYSISSSKKYDDICPITREYIEQGDKFMLCEQCNYGFHLHAINIWFKNHTNCPMCRNSWKNFRIYKND